MKRSRIAPAVRPPRPPLILGAHMSIAGGVSKALDAAREYGCQTVQLFTKSPSQWSAKPLDEGEIRRFQALCREQQVVHPTAHDSYLINLASQDEALFARSVDALAEEVLRAEALQLSYLVMHPGAHLGAGEGVGLRRVIDGINLVHDRTRGVQVRILVETTAGQGSTLGYRLEHLQTVLHGVREPERLGVCVDSCHVFAAGYDWAMPEGFEGFWQEFADRLTLQPLKLFHVNDSVKGCGSRVDRHAGLGLGQMGLGPFRRLMTDPRFHGIPMILETPKEKDGNDRMDAVNLAVLRECAGG